MGEGIIHSRETNCGTVMHTLQNITPTAEQLPILADAGAGFRLIRGAAGSGKTTTALMRLRQLCRSRIARKARIGSEEPVRVLVLTFNRTLRGYINQLVSEQVTALADIELTVETFAGWALNIVGPKPILDYEAEYRGIREFLLRAEIPVASLDYFVGEVEYILGRFTPDQRAEYIGTQRSGRGSAPAVNRQLRARILADVIEPYETWKFNNGKFDWNDLALELSAAPNRGYDVVVVDETQDLSANQMRAVIAHLNEDHVTTFIIDAAQRIYPQSFQWRELGIEMRPQMVFNLASNYRNTVEIARFASSLVQGLPPDEDGVLPDALACQQAGPRPTVVSGKYSQQLDYMLDMIQPFLSRGETVAILQPRGGGWFAHAKKTLQQRGISYCDLTRSRDWPTGPELVALSTIHSAKGLEFDHVLLPGLNQEVTPHGDEEGDGTLHSLRRLLAMGIGRARHTVSVGYKPGEESTLIELLDPITYQLVEF